MYDGECFQTRGIKMNPICEYVSLLRIVNSRMGISVATPLFFKQFKCLLSVFTNRQYSLDQPRTHSVDLSTPLFV